MFLDVKNCNCNFHAITPLMLAHMHTLIQQLADGDCHNICCHNINDDDCMQLHACRQCLTLLWRHYKCMYGNHGQPVVVTHACSVACRWCLCVQQHASSHSQSHKLAHTCTISGSATKPNTCQLITHTNSNTYRNIPASQLFALPCLHAI
jgi:hypothetical protein